MQATDLRSSRARRVPLPVVGGLCIVVWLVPTGDRPAAAGQAPSRGLSQVRHESTDPDQTPDPTDEARVWAYDPEGRRDPFVSLLDREIDPRPSGERPGGLAGLRVSEVSLRGLVSAEGQHLAVLEGPDRKTYILRGGEKLFDGFVKLISADWVVFVVEVNHPLSVVKVREVRRNPERCRAGPVADATDSPDGACDAVRHADERRSVGWRARAIV